MEADAFVVSAFAIFLRQRLILCSLLPWYLFMRLFLCIFAYGNNGYEEKS